MPKVGNARAAISSANTEVNRRADTENRLAWRTDTVRPTCFPIMLLRSGLWESEKLKDSELAKKNLSRRARKLAGLDASGCPRDSQNGIRLSAVLHSS